MSDCCDNASDKYVLIQAWIVPDEDTQEPSIWIAQRGVYMPPVQGIQLKFQIVLNGYEGWRFPDNPDWNGFCHGLKMKRKKDEEFAQPKSKWPFTVVPCSHGLSLRVQDEKYDGDGYDFKLLFVKGDRKIASRDPSIHNRS
jgi:hypothetical protein